jgi:hypothetical protein
MSREWEMSDSEFIKKKYLWIIITIVVILTLTLIGFRVVGQVRAEEQTWVQDSWSGGQSDDVITTNLNTYLSKSNMELGSTLTVGIKDDWPSTYTDWNHRKEITIDNSLDTLNNFQVEVILDTATMISSGELQTECQDLRFANSSGVELDYWIESGCNTDSTEVWVEVDELLNGSSTMYMYYSNPTAESASSGVDTFLLFESFDILPEDWTAESSPHTTWEVVDEVLVSTKINNDYSSYTKDESEFEDFVLEVDWKYDNVTHGGPLFRGQAQAADNSYQWILRPTYNPLQSRIQKRTSGSQSYPISQRNSSTDTDSGVWYLLSLKVIGTQVDAYIDGEPAISGDMNDTTYSTGKVGFQHYDGINYYDNFRIRKAVTDDPIVGAPTNKEIKYEESAYLESNVFNTTYASDWGLLSYITSIDNAVSVKVRSSNFSSMSGALDWDSCDEIASGSDISSSNGINDEDQYIQYRIEFDMTDQPSPPVFESILISYSASDQTDPGVNAHGVYIDGDVESGQWINFEPTFRWLEGEDGEGELLGYYISLTELNISDVTTASEPSTSSGVLSGIDDGVDDDDFTYIVTDTYIDLSLVEGLTLTSNKKYHISIQAVDLAGNYWKEDPQGYQNLEWFKYDDTRPENVMYISTPSSTFGSVNDMSFNWPITGQAIASDTESDILGWQYAINSIDPEEWRGTTTHDFLDIEYIPIDSGISMIQLDEDVHGGDVIVGNNTVYFRTIDNAGNVSTYVTGGIDYGGEAPEFPAESAVTITPETSKNNSFALNWPSAQVGEEKTLKSYYYMINTQPPKSIDTLTSNGSTYRPTLETNIPMDLITGAVKGENTVYVVAVDSDDNYSPTNCIQGTFTLNSNIPDPPLNFSVSDTSIKEAELWRVALTWEEPAYKGNGDIKYIVEKSLNGNIWTELDRLTGNAYSDISDDSREYHYRVATVDSSNESMNNPNYSESLNITPVGRFTTPAGLASKPVVSEVTTRKAKVSWSTDRNSDSKLQYGVSSGQYFDSEISKSTQTTEHILDMNNLLPGTTYYVKAKWTDVDGNTGVSPEFAVQTKPAPVVENVQVDSVGLNYAIFKLTTTGATKARIVYGLTNNYGGSQEINTSTASSEYSIMLTELQDGTDYHYKIILTDEEGFEYESFEDHVFTTPPRPQVSNVQIQEKKGVPTPTIEVFWESNIAVNSIVRYSSNGKSLDKVDMELIEGEHTMEIEGLDPDSEYQLTVEGVDAMGNRAVSDVYAFTTATDTRPPEISSIKSEGDIQSSDVQNDRSRSAQLIISWKTDEPSTSQVLYGEGASSDGYPYSTQTDSQMRYEHVMIVSNLSPSKVYHFKVVSKDSAGNVGESGSVTSITPKSTDTVMESVLGSLGRIFNFL